ncbi:unnamed protein product [Didymodactylos carnosus]|uniref:Uncharacterized protein n=1 Tax=Didymodactylos carnosus TaxID=1234261 RepID=A0A815I4I7_9BILA|nr:unnamed protein product [Didymodactylos carnosus]CAF1361308.1 unnamed protein product [Didymodactylos carnosus]CAF4143262.1 unnamed protein product [Didymodactylos carnosus]CAF4240117.1 unnamed protein product [Didymodactylos carnosus]
MRDRGRTANENTEKRPIPLNSVQLPLQDMMLGHEMIAQQFHHDQQQRNASNLKKDTPKYKTKKEARLPAYIQEKKLTEARIPICAEIEDDYMYIELVRSFDYAKKPEEKKRLWETYLNFANQTESLWPREIRRFRNLKSQKDKKTYIQQQKEKFLNQEAEWNEYASELIKNVVTLLNKVAPSDKVEYGKEERKLHDRLTRELYDYCKEGIYTNVEAVDRKIEKLEEDSKNRNKYREVIGDESNDTLKKAISGIKELKKKEINLQEQLPPQANNIFLKLRPEEKQLLDKGPKNTPLERALEKTLIIKEQQLQ